MATAGAVAGCGSATAPADSATTTATTTAATTTTTTTNDAATSAPVPVAQLVALARGSLPGLGDSTVTSASVVATTKEAAENWLEPGSVPAGASNPRAYLIVLHGRFVCRPCSRPSGASAPRGSSAQFIWVPGRGVTDFAVTPSVPTGLHHLGRVVKIRIGLPRLPKGMPPPGVRRVVMPSHAAPATPWHAVPSHVVPVAPARTVAPSAPSRVVPVTPPGMEDGTPVH